MVNCAVLCAQERLLSDTTETIVIEASKINLASQSLKTEDSNLATAINNTSPIQLQSNGPGLLSTALIRGFGARHTAILWEEFNIQSPINGTFDLSLINGFNKVSYTNKSLSAYIGTASLAGAIILDQNNATKATKVALSLSSTDNFNVLFSHSFQVSKLNSSFQLAWIENDNKFNYEWGGERNKWITQVKGRDLKWNNELQLTNQLQLNANIWVSLFDRQLPSSLSSTITFANQVDNNYRYNAGLVYTSATLNAKINYAHFDEQLNYFADVVDSRANNKVDAINFSLSKSKHLINLSIRQDKVDANFFSEIITRKLTSLSYQYSHQWSKGLISKIVLGEQLFDSDWSPLLFDFSTSYFTNNFEAALSVNSAYNIPTLNDLYWPQGGNSSLLPERSYGLDFNIKYAFNDGLDIEVDPYIKQVSNWILWTPGDQFWSPKNQRSVISKGFDASLNYSISNMLLGGLLVSLTNTTISKESTFQELVGKQLIYIPKWKSTLWIDYQWNNIHLNPSLLLVSERFTTTDNQSSLPGYSIVNFEISSPIKLKSNQEVRIGIIAYNLLNTDYQQVQFYPMPLRYFELNINYKIKRK